MPDGQIISQTSFPTLRIKGQTGIKSKLVPVSAAVGQLRHADLLARNAVLQSALERQQKKAADLRSILCSMDIATLCVSPDLKLRLFTQSASRLLNIGPEQVGATLSLAGPYDLEGTLMAHITSVLGSGIAQDHVLPMGSAGVVMCRLLPLYAFEADAQTVDGVIITYATVHSASGQGPLPDAAAQSPDATPGQANGDLAAGYPGLGCGLTLRQHQVLGHVLAGHPSKNIAADLGISQRTVENHRAAIMARTGATSLPALARLAIGANVGGDCKPAHARLSCD